MPKDCTAVGTDLPTGDPCSERLPPQIDAREVVAFIWGHADHLNIDAVKELLGGAR